MSSASFLAPVFFLLSFVASSAHFVLLFGCLLLASVALCLSLRLVALCVCTFSPLLLALFCCLCSGVSDIGFLVFASTQGLRRGPLVDVAVLGFSPLGCEVLRFGSRASFHDASPSFHCPYPASQLLPVFLQGFRSEYCGGVSSRERALAPSHLFTAEFFCLFWLWLPFSTYLSSSFCRALLLFFPCLYTTFLGFSCACLGLVSDLFCYLALLFPALSRFGSSHMIPFSASFSFVSVVLLRLLVGWCFLLWGFPRCTSSWLSCGCSFVRFLASSLPVPYVLGFPVGLWALFCLGRISGSHHYGVFPLGRGSYLLGFLHSFSFLVMHMPSCFL